MNPNFLDDPDFTAYALGEATLEQTTKVRQLLANNPTARLEFERLQATIDALQQSPPPPNLTLHPRQRETVLAMGQIKSLPPASLHPQHRPKSTPSIAWSLGKFAAAAAIIVAAFNVGQHFSTSNSTPATAQQQTTHPTEAHHTTPRVSLANKTQETSSQSSSTLVSNTGLLPESAISTSDLITLPDSMTLAVSSASEQTNTTTNPTTNTPLPETNTILPAPIKPTSGFTLTSQNHTSNFLFKPNDARRLNHEFAGVILASPTPIITPTNNRKNPKRATPQPPLLVRSWKSEIASCPWDENRRLMRLVAQIPVDQPALEFNEANYQIQANFDSKQVLAHRLVAEKHLRPANGRTQSTRIVWYELILQPNVRASEDQPITLGQLKIQQPGTNRSKAASDNENDFQLIDRGTPFKHAREDFVFETAMVGFGLLLQGTENIGALNHDLVLNIAESSSKAPPTSERTKFIQSVHQAKSAAGL